MCESFPLIRAEEKNLDIAADRLAQTLIFRADCRMDEMMKAELPEHFQGFLKGFPCRDLLLLAVLEFLAQVQKKGVFWKRGLFPKDPAVLKILRRSKFTLRSKFAIA